MAEKSIFTSKTFLYVLVFLAVTSILGYIAMNDEHSLIVFMAAGLLSTFFTDNMAVVLTIAIVFTNLLKVAKIRLNLFGLEGLESMEEGEEEDEEEDEQGFEDMEDMEDEYADDEEEEEEDDDEEEEFANEGFTLFDGFKEGMRGSKKAHKKNHMKKLRKHFKKKHMHDGKFKKKHVDNFETIEGFKGRGRTQKSGMKNKEGATTKYQNETKFVPEKANVEKMKVKTKQSEKMSNRALVKSQSMKPAAVKEEDDEDQDFIDHSATLEAAYDNMEKILGSGGIKKLSGDTQRLMQQQQGLTEHMKTMLPMVSQATEMLKNFDMSKVQGLAGMTNLGGKPSSKKGDLNQKELN